MIIIPEGRENVSAGDIHEILEVNGIIGAKVIANVINEIGNEISKHQNELGSVRKIVERIENKTNPVIRLFDTVVEGTQTTSDNAPLNLQDDFTKCYHKGSKKNGHGKHTG